MQTTSTISPLVSIDTMDSPLLDELLKALGCCLDEAGTLDESVSKALECICTESSQPLAVNEVVAAADSSRRTLERRFRSTVRCTIREAITTAQLLRAKRLLTETTMPVVEVALASGFSYADRLGKVFSRLEGMTPTEFREQAKG